MTVYAKIENGKLITAYNGYDGIIGFADDVDIMTKNGFTPYDDELVAKYFADVATIQEGELIDISDTEEYKAKLTEKEKQNRRIYLTAQINELDLKRIRAGFEPAIKDETTGETYLEYYTNQIITLRNEISGL